MTHPATPDWLRRMGVELPILQAPMAGSQGSVLAIAVSEAGGLGALPAAMLSPQALRDELAAITTATHRPYNVNFFAHTPPQPDPQREAAWREALAPVLAASHTASSVAGSAGASTSSRGTKKKAAKKRAAKKKAAKKKARCARRCR